MIRIDRLFFTALISLSFISANIVDSFPQSSCDLVKVDQSISKGKNADNEITLRAKGGTRPYHYVFFKESGQLLSEEYKTGKLKTNFKGTVYYAVKDAKGCTVKANILLE